MRLSVRILRFRRVPIRVHLSFVLLPAFLGWRMGTAADLRLAALQSLLLVLIFACVVLHEMGHAAVALHYDIPISEITLYPFGGVAQMERRPPSGSIERAIAAAGPAVNLVLAAIVLAATGGGALTLSGSSFHDVLSFLFWGNLVIAGFNLLPAFPLDGGRVARGALASRLGWVRATVWTASAGQALAVALMVAGVLHEPWLFLAGLLLFPGANSELRLALKLRALDRSRVEEVMLRNVELVGPDASLAALAASSREAPGSEYVVHDGTRALGFLPAARLWASVRQHPGHPGTAGEASSPMAAAIAGDASLSDALDLLEREQRDVAPVVDAQGHIVGVILRQAIQRAQSMNRAVARRDRSQ